MKSLTSRWQSITLLVVLSGMIVVITRTATSQPATIPRARDAQHAARVETQAAGTNDVRLDRPPGDWIGGLGIIEAAQPESRLAPAVPGRIAAIRVREGDRVTAGTILVELENGPERAAYAATVGDVAVAEAQLARSRRGVRVEDQEALSTEAQSAHGRADLSAGILARLEQAARGGGATVDELDRARRTADVDRLSALTADARERSGRSGRREDVLVANAQLQASLARRDQARAALDRLRVVAPIDGEILQIHYRVGEYVQPGGASEPLVVIADTRTTRARIDIDERDVGRVANGSRAVITAEAFGGRRFEGHVVEVGRRMGRKNLRTDEPTERIDTKILEIVVELGSDAQALVLGQRVMAYVAPGS